MIIAERYFAGDISASDECYCLETDVTRFSRLEDHCSGTNVMNPGRSGEKRALRWGRFVVSNISVGTVPCGEMHWWLSSLSQFL